LEEGNSFCTKCGLERSRIIGKIDRFPSELKDLVELLLGNLDEAFSDPSFTSIDQMVIKCTEDVYNVPETLRGRIYAAGSVTFAPSETYFLDISYGDRLLQSALFKNTAVIRREADDERYVAIYTDQGNYRIGSKVIGDMSIREVSRDPLVIVRYMNDFYMFCPKKGPYIELEGKAVMPQRVQDVYVNQKICLNKNVGLSIRLK